MQIFYHKFIGREFQALVEKDNLARLENFIQVKLDGISEQGTLVNVKLFNILDGHIQAKMIR